MKACYVCGALCWLMFFFGMWEYFFQPHALQVHVQEESTNSKGSI